MKLLELLVGYLVAAAFALVMLLCAFVGCGV
jgi:hypothetical protein